MSSEPASSELSEAGASLAQAGDTLGRYRLLKKIARGGMAEVFAARSFGAHGFEKTVAIKRILPRYGQDAQFVRMMVDEAKITVLLNHPNVASIVELCEEQGDYFIVMEFVPGQSLSGVVKKLRERGERFGTLEAAFIVVELLQGLHAAHVQKDASGAPAHIIHRDVSPQNVLVSFDGHVKVIDFGIARARDRLEMTEIGTIKGKLRYLAPEMIDPARFMKSGDFDHRVDVFAAGIVLWELVANRTLYQGDDEMVVYDAITDTDAPDLHRNGFCDAALARIAMKALTRDPEKRYLSAEDFADDLRAYVYRTDPSFTHKRIAAVMEKVFPKEKEELLALERGQFSGQHPKLNPSSQSAPGAPTVAAPPPSNPAALPKAPAAASTHPPQEVVRVPADAETRTQHVSGGPFAPVSPASTTQQRGEPTRAMRSGDSNKRLPEKERKQGEVLTAMTLVSRASGQRKQQQGQQAVSASGGARPLVDEQRDFQNAQNTVTAALALPAERENETPYTSESLRSLPRNKAPPPAARSKTRQWVLLAAISVVGIAVFVTIAMLLSSPVEPEPVTARHKNVKAAPIRLKVQSDTPGAVASALGNTPVAVPATFDALPGDALTVTVSAPGYQEWSSRVEVPAQDAKDQVLDVSLTPVEVALRVSVSPADAVVVVGNEGDEKEYAPGMTITPNVPTMVTASAPGFAVVRREVLAKVGEPLDVMLELAPVDDNVVERPVEKNVEKRPPPREKVVTARTATLMLKTKDMWGQVTIDGKTYEESTPLTVELKPGRHSVTVAHPPKGLKKSFSITLKPGETASRTVVLD